MKLRDFERRALEYWEEIPEQYKEGIDGVRVLRRSKAHDELPDVYTLGECITEAYPSDFGGPETIRSAVALYHGSFSALAQLDPDFDWEDELWETLTHELQHHLESLANEDALEDVDYAADENFKRYEGESFDPLFYRAGTPVERRAELRIGAAPPAPLGGWRVEGDWFFELEYHPSRPPAGPATLDWEGARHAFELLAPRAAVTFVALGGDFAPAAIPGLHVDEVHLVLVRRRSAMRAMADALLSRVPASEEVEVAVTSAGPP